MWVITSGPAFSWAKCLLKDTVNTLARKLGMSLHFVVEIIFISPSPPLSLQSLPWTYLALLQICSQIIFKLQILILILTLFLTAVPTEVWIWNQIPRNWSYTQLWALIWVLGTEPRSLAKVGSSTGSCRKQAHIWSTHIHEYKHIHKTLLHKKI